MGRLARLMVVALALAAAVSPSWGQEETYEPPAYEPGPYVEDPPAYEPSPYAEDPLAYEPGPYVEEPPAYEPSLEEFSGPAGQVALQDQLFNEDPYAVSSEPDWEALAAARVPTENQPESSSPEALERPDPKGPPPMSMEEARKLLSAAGQLAAESGFTPAYAGDGCFIRAHLYEVAARREGYEPERVYFIPGTSRIPEGQQELGYNYHTAIVVPVVGDDGVPRKMVLDPTLDPSAPTSLANWMGDADKVYIPGDANVPAGTRHESVVTVASGSTADPSHFIPASLRDRIPADGRLTMLGEGEEVYQGREDRYTWTPPQK